MMLGRKSKDHDAGREDPSKLAQRLLGDLDAERRQGSFALVVMSTGFWFFRFRQTWSPLDVAAMVIIVSAITVVFKGSRDIERDHRKRRGVLPKSIFRTATLANLAIFLLASYGLVGQALGGRLDGSILELLCAVGIGWSLWRLARILSRWRQLAPLVAVGEQLSWGDLLDDDGPFSVEERRAPKADDETSEEKAMDGRKKARKRRSRRR